MEVIPTNQPVLEPMPRRSFLMALFAVSGACVSALLAIPVVRFVTFPLRKAAMDDTWSEIGPVQELGALTAPTAKTITLERRDAWQTSTSQTAVYVLPQANGAFRVLSPVCPHLGCSVRWVDAQNRFICPCHSGQFTAEGTRISGPPPRSMDSLETKIEDGVLKVRYQYFRQLVATKEEIA